MSHHRTKSLILKSIDSGMSYPIIHDTNLIGRNQKKCDIVIKHSSISKIHCVIFLHHNRFFLVDLGSRNGIFVNRKRVRLIKLSAGDELGIGRFRFQFVDISDPPTDEIIPLETTRNKQGTSDHNFDPVSPVFFQPTVLACDTPVVINDVKLVELENADTDVAFYLDDDIENNKETTYRVAPSNDNYEFPPGGDQRRPNHPESYEEKKKRRGVRNILFSVNIDTENPLLKRAVMITAVILVCLGLKTFWYSGSTDFEIYNVLQAELERIQTLRRTGAGISEWTDLANRTEIELEPVIQYLEKNASAENRVKQELLRAVRDCLPKLIQESRQEVSWHEIRFEKHLKTARLILQNGSVKEDNYDSHFPAQPIGTLN